MNYATSELRIPEIKAPLQNGVWTALSENVVALFSML